MLRKVVVFTFFVLVNTQEILINARTTKATVASLELCGSETDIELTKTGETASRIVTLSPNDPEIYCKLRVFAPKSHAINLQFLKDDDQDELLQENHRPCVMSIFLPDNPRIPVWKGDICSKAPPNPPDLLTADIKIMWAPPPRAALARGRRFAVTAVGRGAACREPGQHTCMRIGWDPILCVSDRLVCDGVAHCPPSATHSDEDEAVCSRPFFAASSLEQLAVEIFKKWKPSQANEGRYYDKHDRLVNAPTRRTFSWRDWKDVRKVETTTVGTTTQKSGKMTPKVKATDSISQVLSKYGPWGYLMIGMLICGTVLMFCGLWECCFRKPKTEIAVPAGTHQPTTVLVINRAEEVANPPNYDELDQPPLYTTLFPNIKNQTPATSSAQLNEQSAPIQEQPNQQQIAIDATSISNEEIVQHEETT